MVCFNGSGADFIVRALVYVQVFAKIGMATVAILEIVTAYSSKDQIPSNNPDDPRCACILKTKPTPTCNLVEEKCETNRVLWDPLFLVLCFWVALLSLSGIVRDIRYGANRFMNCFLFLFNGSVFLTLGEHYDLEEFFIIGAISLVLFIILLLSVPMCGRNLKSEIDEESHLLDNDEFGQGNGAFASLNE
jgi:hypothetical protein